MMKVMGYLYVVSLEESLGDYNTPVRVTLGEFGDRKSAEFFRRFFLETYLSELTLRALDTLSVRCHNLVTFDD